MKLLTAVVAVFAVSTAVFAQSPPAKRLSTNSTSAPVATQVPAKNWPRAPLNPAVTAFPAQFNGVNTEDVVAWAEKATAPRGEFETSEAYQARVATLSRQPISGSISREDLMAFVYKIPDSYVKYDADAQSFKLEWTPLPLKAAGKPLGIAYTVSSRNEQSSYVGTNAYGAKTDIQKIEIWSTQLLAAKPFGTGKIASAFDVPLNQAPAVKANLAFAYLARISDPNMERVESTTTPTRDSPREIAIHYTALHANIEQIIVFDQATGQIFARLTE